MGWGKDDARSLQKILDMVLPEYESISKAPRSLTDFPAAMHMRGHELDEFEDRMRAAESLKTYKAIDDKGNVFTLRNPWIATTITQSERVRAVAMEPPKLVLRAAEAEAIAKGRKVAEKIDAQKLPALSLIKGQQAERDW